MLFRYYSVGLQRGKPIPFKSFSSGRNSAGFYNFQRCCPAHGVSCKLQLGTGCLVREPLRLKPWSLTSSRRSDEKPASFMYTRRSTLSRDIAAVRRGGGTVPFLLLPRLGKMDLSPVLFRKVPCIE